MIKVVKEKFTKGIKKNIKYLDDTISYYTNVDISWYDRYSCDSYIYLLKDGADIVGYLYGAFITEGLYNSLINGEIIHDYTINKEEFIENSHYIYLTSIVIKDEYRNKHYGSLLLEKFLNDLQDEKVVVLTISKSGYNLVNKYFKLHRKIDDIHTIFINKE